MFWRKKEVKATVVEQPVVVDPMEPEKGQELVPTSMVSAEPCNVMRYLWSVQDAKGKWHVTQHLLTVDEFESQYMNANILAYRKLNWSAEAFTA